MRKCVNAEHLEGYVYQHSLTVKQVKNEQSKNFGHDYLFDLLLRIFILFQNMP